MKAVLFIFISLLFLGSCGGVEDENPGKEKRYPIEGVVLELNKEEKTAKIDHEEIKGYMDKMTMTLTIKKPDWFWSAAVVGSKITGELVVNNVKGESWVEVTGIVAPESRNEATKLREDKDAVGKKITDFALTNQDGKKIGPKDFAGKVWAITFIYAQCPLPEFCILMSKNFSDTANEIIKDDDLSERFRLLSISFDPERDTPAKLRSYGLGYLGNKTGEKGFDVWQLAVGKDKEVRKVADFSGLRYEVDAKDKTQFNHSLRTVIIDKKGEVRKVLSGNDWKPEDLINAMKAAEK